MVKLLAIILLLPLLGFAQAFSFRDTAVVGNIVPAVAGGGGGGAITIVGTNSMHTTAAGTSMVCPLSNVVSGALISLWIANDNLITTPSGYTFVTNASDFCETTMCYKIASGSENSVTVTTLSGQGSIIALIATGISATPLDKVVSRTAQGNPIVAGTTGTTSQADELAFAGAGISLAGGLPTYSSIDNSFILIADEASTGSGTLIRAVAAYKILTATGTQICNFTMSSTGNGHNSAAIATFKK